VRDQPDENRSVWVAESEAPRPADPLRAVRSVDVAIIGGGFTGVSTAWHLRQRRPELGIALLEAGVLGQGASGRNGGQVLNWINGVTPATPEQARAIHAATRAGIDLAEDLSRRYAPGAFRRRELVRSRVHRFQALKASRAATSVASISPSPCAAETKPAS